MKVTLKKTAPAVKPRALVGSTGMSELIYTGRCEGVVSWFGTSTGHQYKAGRAKPRIFVDSNDVDGALSQWKEKDVLVFVRAPIRPVPAKMPTLPPVDKSICVPETATISTEGVDAKFCTEAKDASLAGDPTPVDVAVVEVEATESAKQLAQENNISLRDVFVSLDKTGRVTAWDVRKFIENHTNDTGNV